MNEVIKHGKHTFFIDCPSVTGVFTNDGQNAYAIDSGNRASAGKQLLKTLAEQNLLLKSVFATHAHADHIGGCGVLQQRTGCSVYVPEDEYVLAKTTSLNPGFIYGGFAPKMLGGKFFIADSFSPQILNASALPAGLTAIPLPGHSFSQTGYITDDNVFFIADSVVGSDTLEKYKISYLYDVEKYLLTLDFLDGFNADLFVPSHAAATGNITDLTSINRKSVLLVCEAITDIIKTPLCFDELLAALFTRLNMEMNFGQYALIGSTTRSYLSYLINKDAVEAFADGAKILWLAK